ncbi:MAG: hypothetical protein WCD76_20425 [Pyrinomonadaceae bacterium]
MTLQQRQGFSLGRKKRQLTGQFSSELRALFCQHLPATFQGHHTMVTKQRSQNPKPLLTNQQREFLKLFALIAVVVSLGISIYLALTVNGNIERVVGKQLTEPLQRLVRVEEKVSKLDAIDQRQVSIQQQLTELGLQLKLYFGERSFDRKTIEEILEKTIGLVRDTQDPIEKTVALNITNDVLDKASAKNIVLERKKVNQHGLTLLGQNYGFDQQDKLKAAVSKLARQRTLQPAPIKILKEREQNIVTDKKIPKEQEQKIITGKEINLDANSFEDVTFENCSIIYGQGWIGIKNVHFVNCTFDVFPIDKGKELYEALFKSDEPIPSVTVSSGVPLPNSTLNSLLRLEESGVGGIPTHTQKAT